jgi:hypothetical protein
MIPLNDREEGKIAQVALDQLAPFRAAAQQWPIYYTIRDARSCMACRVCHFSLWFLRDIHETPYQISEEEKTTLTVAHIRQSHTEMVIINEAGHLEVLDFPTNPSDDYFTNNTPPGPIN